MSAGKLKKMRLQTRFFSYFTGLVLLIIIFISTAIYLLQKSTLLNQAMDKSVSLSETLAHSSVSAILSDDYIVLQELIDAMSIGRPDIVSIMVLDTTGKIIVSNLPERRGQMYSDPILEDLLSLNTPVIKEVSGKDNTWDAAYPIYDLNKRIATSRLTFTVEDTYKGLLLTILAIGFIAVIISITLSYKFSKDISKPIKEAVNLADAYGRGNLDAAIEIVRDDEIGQLVRSLNKLSNDLKNLIEEKITNESLVLIGEFAAFIIHDLKNPLSGIHLLSDGLHRRIQDNTPLKKYSTELLLAVQKLQDFVARTLDIARWSRLDIQEVDLHPLIDQALAAVNTTTIKVAKFYDTNMQTIRGDYKLLLMAVRNLLVNAVEAMQNNGQIKIETKWNNSVQIMISDTGMGIAGDRLQTIFRPFYSKKENGHGLGLAMVKKAVIMHQGIIKVESRLYHGTKFIITLPKNLPDFTISEDRTTK